MSNTINETGQRKLDQLFVKAIQQCQADKLVEAISKGVDPNIEVYHGQAALHVVSEGDNMSLFNILIKHPNINIEIRNFEGFTPLMVATINSRRDMVLGLLRKGADPNAASALGNRALHFACRLSHMGIVFDLITNGGQVNGLSNCFDVTPLAIAAIDSPSMIITRYLLRKGAVLSGSKQFPLLLECALACNNERRLATLRILIDYGMDINQVHPMEKRNCLHYAAISGYTPLAEYLLSEGADLDAIDATGRTPLEIARDHQNSDVVWALKHWRRRKKINFADQKAIIEVLSSSIENMKGTTSKTKN
ncbi:unnamed protein product [Phaedon cochleariae]|uniref:Ankyrin repeat protein n=1 Tax=Phaedon cochleariae TaxID=80249 RepID=A0A9P0DNC6_PHACE|nr:unnamed protein product [Phaedon cochleariae]